jgi:hypothetical protein
VKIVSTFVRNDFPRNGRGVHTSIAGMREEWGRRKQKTEDSIQKEKPEGGNDEKAKSKTLSLARSLRSLESQRKRRKPETAEQACDGGREAAFPLRPLK